MKHQLFNRCINYLFLLIFSVACSKTVETTPPPPPPPPPPPITTVTISDDNWVKVDQGKYVSDLYAAVKKYDYNFSTIISVSVNYRNSQLPLQPGSTVSLDGAELSLGGTTLYYSSASHYGQYGPPVQGLSLNVTIN